MKQRLHGGMLTTIRILGLERRRILAVTVEEMTMTKYVCCGCGTQYGESTQPPVACRVCVDDRQHVSWDGQRWTTHDELGASHDIRIEMDGDLFGIGITPSFAIPQRALHVSTDAGNIMWDCTSLVTDAAVSALQRRGGVDLIVISHPHFYSSMIE
jgi:hypothetical protein